jgi:hypothetical protein
MREKVPTFFWDLVSMQDETRAYEDIRLTRVANTDSLANIP